MHVQTNVPDAGDGSEVITTLEDLGRYLQELREKRHVTQASLSAKTGAITGRQITRSRISEIENAKRDQVAERELRGYMLGLKCTRRHIDQMVKARNQCTATPPKESADLDSTSSATPDPYPAGLGGAEDGATLREEKSGDDPTAAGHEEEGCERWPQVDTRISPFGASQPQPARRRWQCHRIVLVTATTLVVVGFAGLGVESFLRRENGDRPTSPGGPTALLAPPSAPLMSEDAADFSHDVTPPRHAPVWVNKRSVKISKIPNRPDLGNAISRDATRQLVERCCVGGRKVQGVGAVPLSHGGRDWRSYLAEFGGGR